MIPTGDQQQAPSPAGSPDGPSQLPARQSRDDRPQRPPTIQLDQFLKAHRLVESGGEAKFRIQHGDVLLNGQIETRRRKKLLEGDIVTIDGGHYPVAFDE